MRARKRSHWRPGRPAGKLPRPPTKTHFAEAAALFASWLRQARLARLAQGRRRRRSAVLPLPLQVTPAEKQSRYRRGRIVGIVSLSPGPPHKALRFFGAKNEKGGEVRKTVAQRSLCVELLKLHRKASARFHIPATIRQALQPTGSCLGLKESAPRPHQGAGVH
jgi:hypothetical protein